MAVLLRSLGVVIGLFDVKNLRRAARAWKYLRGREEPDPDA
jgi:hypothetical protein